MTYPLSTWTSRPSRTAILDFVARVTSRDGPDFVPPDERIAVFDNDGTLWCEKPMPIELGFVLARLAAMAEADPSLRERQPWKAAYEGDHEWLGDVVTRHYRGDDAGVRVLMGGILKAFEGMTVDEYGRVAREFVMTGRHAAHARHYRDSVYRPMVDLLRFLETNGFTTFIVSGGDRDFMRPVTGDLYGIPPERVVGSSSALRYREGPDGGSVVYLAQPDVFDDGAAKPVRIWSRTGRRPILAFGNSNGDIQMLQFAGGTRRPALRLLLAHDDRAREFEYVAGAEQALDLARRHGWTVVSMKDDWKEIFQSGAGSRDGVAA